MGDMGHPTGSALSTHKVWDTSSLTRMKLPCRVVG